jgi:hypothetical protein
LAVPDVSVHLAVIHERISSDVLYSLCTAYRKWPYYGMYSLSVHMLHLRDYSTKYSSDVAGGVPRVDFRVSEENTASVKMEAVYFSETLVSTYNSTWRYNPGDKYRHLPTGIGTSYSCQSI